MNPNTKKVSIRRERHETIIVRRLNRVQMFCTVCESKMDFLTLDEAVNFLQIGTREILTRIETGEIHLTDAPNGQMLVCAKSVARKDYESTKIHE